MSVRIQCPLCQHTMAVHERFSGQRVRCPNCEKPLIVPSLAARKNTKPVRDSLTPLTSRQSTTAHSMSQSAMEGSPRDVHANSQSHVVDHSPAPRRRRAKSNNHSNHHEEAWDITPMVDVAFLLLIFFMVTASSSIEKVIRSVPEPDRNSASRSSTPRPQEESETILIQIDEYNCYSLIPFDGDRIDTPSRQELTTNLKRIRQAADDVPQKILIQAHEDSNHGAIVGAMDAAREADFIHLDFKVVDDFL